MSDGVSSDESQVVQLAHRDKAVKAKPEAEAGGTAVQQRESSPAIQDDTDHLNTDERSRYQWRGRYDPEAYKEINMEARLVAGIMILTFLCLFLVWRGTAFEWLAGGCADCSRRSFDRYSYFYLSGQLGGILFGVKYLYKVVARGFWNIDRRLWRYFSPFLSGGLALVVGALTDSGILGVTTKSDSAASYFSLGFIAGYFADSALAKMQEIADTIFGPPSRGKTSHEGGERDIAGRRR